MTKQAATPGSVMIPTLRYHDAPRAMTWLCEVFGFERHFVVPGDDGTIAHAQLTYGTGMLMIGSWRDDEWGALVKTTRQAGMPTGAVYVVVADPDAHHARAVAAGADVVYGPRDTPYGSRDYCVRDPEGNVWSFGTYDPWK